MENSDIADSRLAECEEKNRNLSKRLEELTDFFENASLPLHWVDSEGKIIWANKAELDFLGYAQEEYFGYCIKDFHADEDVINDIFERLGQNETLINYEATLKCKDGSVKHVLINSNVYRKDGKFIHTRCFTRDITEFKEQQIRQQQLLEELEIQNAALKESERRFSSLADSAPVLLWMSGLDRKPFFFNKAWLRFTGRTLEQEAGLGWMEGIHPEDLQKCIDEYSEAFEKKVEFPIEFRLMRSDGEYRWISGTGVPRFTHDGEFLGFVGGSMDIHDQKNFAQELEDQVSQRTHELHLLNDLLITKNRQLEHSNEELSSFSYAASHDLQAPLRKINTFSSFIEGKDGYHLSPDSKEFLARISLATERMQDLIDSLLNYSRINVEKTIFERTDLNELLAEVKSNLSDLLEEKNADLQVEQLPVLDVVPMQFQQLVVNLVSNSIKYSRTDVRPEIRVSATLIPGTEIAGLGANTAVSYWKFRFEDNGIGFEPEYEEKIFELFHRLHGKKEYEGTGVGLGIVKKIVINHKGFVKATGMPGEGAIFDVYIPAADTAFA